MMKNINRAVCSAVAGFLLFSACAGAQEISPQDWRTMAGKYISADIQQRTDTKYDWDSLVKMYGSKNKSDSKARTETSEQRTILSEWWAQFGDYVLNDLIDMAFRSNKNLEISRSKVIQVREQLGLSRVQLNPQSNGSASYTNGKRAMAQDGSGNSYNDYNIGADVSWELDLFGKKKHDINASKADLDAEYATLHDAWVSLSAEVAVNYVNFRMLQKRIDIAHRNVVLQQEMLAMLESQFSAGLKDGLAMQQEKYNLERTRSSIPALEQNMNSVMNALSLLTGGMPGSLNDLLLNTDTLIHDTDISCLIGIPADTIRQRPDIRAAEKRLEAQTERKKSAKKAVYPTISLAGSIGLESMSTGHLFEDVSKFFSIGPRITWPIFNGGRIRRNIRVQTEIERQLLLSLEQNVLQAVSEVQNAVDACAKEMIREKILKDALKAARAAMNIARDKYIQGLSDFNNVLTAQQAVYSLEDDCASSEAQNIINLITLFKTLGGGWKPLEQ